MSKYPLHTKYNNCPIKISNYLQKKRGKSSRSNRISHPEIRDFAVSAGNAMLLDKQ